MDRSVRASVYARTSLSTLCLSRTGSSTAQPALVVLDLSFKCTIYTHSMSILRIIHTTSWSSSPRVLTLCVRRGPHVEDHQDHRLRDCCLRSGQGRCHCPILTWFRYQFLIPGSQRWWEQQSIHQDQNNGLTKQKPTRSSTKIISVKFWSHKKLKSVSVKIYSQVRQGRVKVLKLRR